jgi:D-xylose 1-dehydrogenase (NADP+, D-xylono-1,5-lactone-forming)
VLGAAWIADIAVLPAIAASENGRLVAIASRDASRAELLASKHSIARVSASYDDLLEDNEVDAVYIPLVNNEHKEWTLRALAAGKHVLCEKPLGMNADEVEEMAAAAVAADRRLMEAFMYRFHPRMRNLVEGLHDAIYVHASFGFTLEDKANYRFQAALGGGALLDVGCYTVSVARWILGEPDEVLARARVDGVDMTVSALLHFPRGRTASVWASFESAEEQELTVVTPHATHRMDRPFTAKDPDPYRLMVESFGESVLKDRPVEITLEESIANMKVLDRIREALTQAG